MDGGDGSQSEATYASKQEREIARQARIQKLIDADLRKSDLTTDDLSITQLTPENSHYFGIPPNSIASNQIYGYVIPYFDVFGNLIPHYARARLFYTNPAQGKDHRPKYLQPKGTPNHVYFPKGFSTCFIQGQYTYRWSSASSIQIYDASGGPQVLPNLISETPEERSERVPVTSTQIYQEGPLTRRKFIIITEGEKKAALANFIGFPTIGLGGIYNWRTNTVVLPEGTKVIERKALGSKAGSKPTLSVKLPSGRAGTSTGLPSIESGELAHGLDAVISLIVKANDNTSIVIVFDSDATTLDPLEPNKLTGTLSYNVQKAASELGQCLRDQGIPTTNIKLLILPAASNMAAGDKIGLDDFIVSQGPDSLAYLLDETLANPHAFPRHPDPKSMVNKELEDPFASRRTLQRLGSNLLMELDARGQRLVSRYTGDPYYFDNEAKVLMPVDLLRKSGPPLHETSFGRFLYRHFGISGADQRIIHWIATPFTSEPPMTTIDPQYVMALSKPPNVDEINIQISDSHFVTITGDARQPISVKTNGADGLMFHQDQVEPINEEELLEAFNEQLLTYKRTGIFENWWEPVIQSSNITNPVSKEICNLLFYISPFLQRWRGIQLPVELFYGEPNSGKSSLLALRLYITTGRPDLVNMPVDPRDWYASISSKGGLHVTDNVNFTNKDVRARISDEICRLITAPRPVVELRKLYTTSQVSRIPVNVTFAFTAITPQFRAQDLLQRSVIIEFQSIQAEHHDSDWVLRHIEGRGGRVRWLAHHLLFLHLFLEAAIGPSLESTSVENTTSSTNGNGRNSGSNPSNLSPRRMWYRPLASQHRLAHFERALNITSIVLRKDSPQVLRSIISGSPEVPLISPYMVKLQKTMRQTTTESIIDTDWVLEAIREFAQEQTHGKPFSPDDVANWAEGSDHYRNEILTNPRRLHRYMSTNLGNLRGICGIVQLSEKSFTVQPPNMKKDT